MQYYDTVTCFENNYRLLQLKKCTNCAPELPLLLSGITSEKRGVKSVFFWCLWAEYLCFYWSNPRQAETVKAELMEEEQLLWVSVCISGYLFKSTVTG